VQCHSLAVAQPLSPFPHVAASPPQTNEHKSNYNMPKLYQNLVLSNNHAADAGSKHLLLHTGRKSFKQLIIN
jgi:hypothetical protein